MNNFNPINLSILLIGLLFLLSPNAFSQGCFNADFETGNLDGYTSFIGNIAGDGTIMINNQSFSPSQHRVHFVLDGFDPIAEEFCTENEFLPMVPQGGGAFAMRLGNSMNGAQAERVTLSFTVTEENNFFLLNYAVLLNDPSHLPHQQPRFRLSILDSQGDQYPCGFYEVVAAPNIENFENCGGNWKVRPWTAIGIELQSYIGERINIEMSTTDCALGGHAGYAYLDANCKPLEIELFNSCDSNNVAKMFVTTGFDKYEWSTGDSTSQIEIKNPVIGDEYTVTVTSATGCSIVLKDTIPPITQELEPVFDPSTVTTICDATAFRFRPGGTNIDNIFSVELNRFIFDSIVVNNVTQDAYTFIAFSNAGCPKDTVTHYFNGLPFVRDSIAKTFCTGTDEGSISLSPLIDGSNYEYLWTTGDTTPYITDLRAGTYRVTVSDENCDHVIDYQVEQPDPITIRVEQDRVICRGYGAEASFSISGGTAPFSYSYNGGGYFSSSNSYGQFKEGNNKIIVRDKNMCMDSVTIYFPLVEIPEIVSFDIFQDSCGNPGNQIRVNSSTSGLPPYEYNVDFSTPFMNQTTFNDFAIGTHTLYVQDANECINSTQFEFKYYEEFYITFLDISNTTCTLSNGDITIETSQTDLVQYAIDNLPYQQGNYFGPLAPGQHTAYTINRNGCLLTRDFNVGPSFLPSPIRNVIDNRCNGEANGQINLTAPNANNPYTYDWSTGETSSSLSDLPDGTYDLTVTDSDGCGNRFSYEIVSPPALEMNVNGTFFSCKDRDSGEIYLDVVGGVGGYSYSIDGGNSYRVDDFFLGLGSDEYTVQVRDGNSCIVETTIKIEDYVIYDDILLDIGNDTCVSTLGSLSIDEVINGAPPHQFSLDGTNFQSTPQYDNLAYGDYTLYVRDNNRCIWEDKFQIDTIYSLYINADAVSTTCEENNGELEVSSSTNYGNLYYLNDSLTGSDSLLTGLSPGAYEIMVENQYGCKDFIDVQIIEGILPAPTNVVVDNECFTGEEGSISLTNPFVSPTYSYEWSTGDVGSSISNLGIGDYKVTVTDPDKCESYFDFEIVSPPQISVDVLGSFFNCPDSDNGEINITASGGSGDLEYSIDGGSSYGTQSNFSGLQSDSYLVRIRDENLCIQDTMIEIADYVNTDDINLIVAMDTCVASNGAVIIENTTQNVTPYSYSIDGTDFYTETKFLDLDYGSYTLFIEDGNGCVWIQDFEIDTMFSIHINAVVVDTECNEDNGQITINASSDFDNKYFLNNDNRGAESVISGLSPQAYKVIVRNQYGCIDSTTVAVLPSKEPIIDQVDVNYLSCENNNNIIRVDVSSGNPPFTYTLDNTLEQPMNDFSNISPGDHKLKVTDEQNCETEIEIFIEEFEPIVVEYDFEDPSCDQADGSVTFDVTGGAGPLSVVYNENNYPADESIEGLYEGLYSFDVVDTTDCVITMSVELEMICTYYIPTSFTPDGDGINDEFEIFFTPGSTPLITEFSVYDRWGEAITQIQNVNPFEQAISWDGTFNGKKVMTGVYTYVISGQFQNGEEIYSQGTITLVR